MCSNQTRKALGLFNELCFTNYSRKVGDARIPYVEKEFNRRKAYILFVRKMFAENSSDLKGQDLTIFVKILLKFPKKRNCS